MPDMTLVNAPLTANRTITFPDASGTISLGAGGLTFFTEAQSTTAPNATVYADSLTAVAAVANADAVISPKGTGALLGQVPDGLTAGGAKRGVNATDWQRTRASAARVASGTDSTIGGGYDNLADAQGATIAGGATNGIATSRFYGTIAGGQTNTIFTSGTHGTIGGGQNNGVQAGWATVAGGASNSAIALYSTISGGQGHSIAASRTHAVIAGGQTNTVGTTGTHQVISGGSSNTTNGAYGVISGGTANTAGAYSVVGGGLSNQASPITGNYSTVSGGESNISNTSYGTIGGGIGNFVSANWGTIAGGEGNLAAFQHSSVPGGLNARTRFMGEVAYANGQFGNNGDCQASMVVLRRSITIGASAIDLTMNGAAQATTNTIVLAASSAYQFHIQVIARDTGVANQYAWWNIVGGIERDSGGATTAIIGTNVVDTGNSGGNSAGWTCVAQANAVDGRLEILVSAPNGTGPVRFGANATLMRVA